MRFKVLLWKLGFYGDYCPYCYHKLVPHYNCDNEYSTLWDCYTKNCKFNG